MIIKMKKYAIYIGFAILFILTLLSTIWTQYGNLSHPPNWAMAASLLSFLTGLVILIYIIVDVLRYFEIGKQVKSKFFALDDLLKTLPELRNIIDELKINVRNGKIIPGTEHFNSLISELNHEFKAYSSKYFMRKLEKFREKVIYNGIFGTIFIFACFYLADYSVEMYFYRTPGFCIKAITGGNLIDFFVESLYYSVITFTTLGYGDICPNTSVLARIISSVEALLFVLLFSVILNLAWNIIQKKYMVEPDDMKDAILYNVKNAAD